MESTGRPSCRRMLNPSPRVSGSSGFTAVSVLVPLDDDEEMEGEGEGEGEEEGEGGLKSEEGYVSYGE